MLLGGILDYILHPHFHRNSDHLVGFHSIRPRRGDSPRVAGKTRLWTALPRDSHPAARGHCCFSCFHRSNGNRPACCQALRHRSSSFQPHPVWNPASGVPNFYLRIIGRHILNRLPLEICSSNHRGRLAVLEWLGNLSVNPLLGACNASALHWNSSYDIMGPVNYEWF